MPNILSILKTVGNSALKVADIGAKANLPVLSQIDKVADTLADIRGKRKVDDAAIMEVVVGLQGLKEAIPELKSAPKKAIESNRFKMTIIGVIVSALAYYGLPEDAATHIAESVFWIISTYVLGDTIRPSLKAVISDKTNTE